MATEKTVTSAAPVVKTETAKPSVAPVAPVKTAPAQEQAPKAESVDVNAPKAAAAAPVEQKSADTAASEKTAPVTSAPAKSARAKTKTRATAKSKSANTAKPKVAKKAKAPRSVKPAEAKLAKPAASPSVQAKQVRGMVSPFGTAEAIGAEVTNATVQLNETISDFVSGGVDRSVRHLEAVRNVKGLDELYSMNTKFFEAEFESWMTVSLKAFGTGSELVGRVSAPMEEQVMSVARTVKDRFAA